ncbi:MAG: TIGR03790 family protein [bacterium]
MRSAPAATILSLCLAGATCAGADPPDGRSVVVLVNTASPASVAVGEHYARRRGVPRSHICRVSCPTGEVISRRQFNRHLRSPLRTFLRKAGLARADESGRLRGLKVRYLVATYGIPVKIREVYTEERLEAKLRLYGSRGDDGAGQKERNAAAVDSELCLVAEPDPVIAGWRRNPLFASPGAQAPLLLATRLDGPTPEIAKGLVDAAIRAENEGLYGVAYVDAGGPTGPMYEPGDRWMRAAARALRRSGFLTRLNTGRGTFRPDMPMPRAAVYLGWYAPDVEGPMAADHFRFAPGAVAYHLHSGSARRLRRRDLGWAGPLLAHGAAATMGSVYEPYLAGTPDLGEFARHFLAGQTFADSAYAASRQLSWMTTFVGDPLYAPFGDSSGATARWPARWRELGEAVRAAEAGEGDRARRICERRPTDPLFIRAARQNAFGRRRWHRAARLSRRLAAALDDQYASVQAYRSLAARLRAAAGDRWDRCDLVGWGAARVMEADACVECVDRYPACEHALPVYRDALRVCGMLGAPATRRSLWRRLAATFPGRPLGRFAGAELWAGGRAESCPVPTVVVPAVTAPPVIDGRGEDAAWKQAGRIAALSHRVGRARAERRIRLRWCHHGAALFVLAEVGFDRPAPSAEALELALSPWRDAQRSAHIPVRKGRTRPLRVRFAQGMVAGFVRTRHNAHGRETGWTAELRVPLSALGWSGPLKGQVWAANVVHRRTVLRFPFRAETVVRSWARPRADPLDPACAGLLLFK